MAAVASPGSDERLQIARRVIANAGIDPVTPQGRDRLRRHLEERMLAVAAESASITTAVDTGNALTASTLFRDRGLSSDTSLVVDYGVDNALASLTRVRPKDRWCGRARHQPSGHCGERTGPRVRVRPLGRARRDAAGSEYRAGAVANIASSCWRRAACS
jgi:hypothetical protein